MNKHIPYLLVIVILFLVIGFNRCENQNTLDITERVISDSTVVDSLTQRIEYLEALPPDTIKVQIEVPAEPDTLYTDIDGNEVREYTTSYTDSLIVAQWTTVVFGELKSQDFTCIPKARPVIKETITRYMTRTKTIERTIQKPQRGFLALGGEIGASPEQLFISPIIRYQAKDGYSYHYRYDIINQSHSVGITIPIRIKIPFL